MILRNFFVVIMYVQNLASSSFDQMFYQPLTNNKNDDLFTSLEQLQILINTNQVLTEYFKEIISYQSKQLDRAKE
jgi:hypothetical protein